MAKYISKSKRNKQYKCSFCDEICNEEEIMIGINKVAICNGCVNIANSLIEDRKSKEDSQVDNISNIATLTPRKLKSQLDEYVIGQEEAKKILSVAIYNHYKRIITLKEEEIDKTNVCLIGASGSGKTLLVKTIAKLINVPFVIADANSFTAAGYSGKNVEDCLLALIKKADGDVHKAEKGIVFIDEIDKIATRETNGKDVGGEAVQQALLKIIEGSVIDIINKRDEMFEETVTIDTTNILFIVGGAFSGIEKIIQEKNDKKGIGFGAEIQHNNNEGNIIRVTQEDLIKFGMIPEFVGRIQTIATLHKLDEQSLMKILTEPKNSLIKQYTKLMEADGVSLQVEESAIKKIANIAIKQKTGARSLKSILDDIMLDYMYSSPDKKKGTINIKAEDVKYSR